MPWRFYWLQCQVSRRTGKILYFWRPGRLNLANYYTKHHSSAHNQNICAEYLTARRHKSAARVCWIGYIVRTVIPTYRPNDAADAFLCVQFEIKIARQQLAT